MLEKQRDFTIFQASPVERNLTSLRRIEPGKRWRGKKFRSEQRALDLMSLIVGSRINVSSGQKPRSRQDFVDQPFLFLQPEQIRTKAAQFLGGMAKFEAQLILADAGRWPINPAWPSVARATRASSADTLFLIGAAFQRKPQPLDGTSKGSLRFVQSRADAIALS